MAAVWQEGKFIIFPKKSDIAVRGGSLLLAPPPPLFSTLAVIAELWRWGWWWEWEEEWCGLMPPPLLLWMMLVLLLLILLTLTMPVAGLIPAAADPAVEGSRNRDPQLLNPRLENDRDSEW